ncbi:MAG: hypothetical protein JSW47_14220, partial [Phycisphaerales bacterium]
HAKGPKPRVFLLSLAVLKKFMVLAFTVWVVILGLIRIYSNHMNPAFGGQRNSMKAQNCEAPTVY